MFQLACTGCDWLSTDADLSACPACGATLDVRYDSPDLPVDPGQPGIWRYAARLPLRDLAHAVSLGEGGTPLLREADPHARLAQLFAEREPLYLSIADCVVTTDRRTPRLVVQEILRHLGRDDPTTAS